MDHKRNWWFQIDIQKVEIAFELYISLTKWCWNLALKYEIYLQVYYKPIENTPAPEVYYKPVPQASEPAVYYKPLPSGS